MSQSQVLNYLLHFLTKSMRNILHGHNLQTTKTTSCNLLPSYFLEQITQQMPLNCPTIIVVGFNIDILIKTYLQSTTLQKLINKHSFKLTFSKSATLHDTQIDHVWMNAPTQQRLFWINVSLLNRSHKATYFAFNFLSIFHNFILPLN